MYSQWMEFVLKVKAKIVCIQHVCIEYFLDKAQNKMGSRYFLAR
jgi:hypothetical protein